MLIRFLEDSCWVENSTTKFLFNHIWTDASFSLRARTRSPLALENLPALLLDLKLHLVPNALTVFCQTLVVKYQHFSIFHVIFQFSKPEQVDIHLERYVCDIRHSAF